MKMGKVIFFLRKENGKCHGAAKIPGERKPLHLADTVMKVYENGKLRNFREGEEKVFPQPGQTVVWKKAQPSRSGFIANAWGVLIS